MPIIRRNSSLRHHRQPDHTVGSDTYSLSYDVENRLKEVQKGGVVVATVGYDGDGKMVTATVGLTTTYYVGNYLEKVNGIPHTYYYHMGKRIAMREGNTLYWLLTDRLGSTAMIIKASEAITGQVRYKAYGETRESSGITTTTKYHFTGQREESTIGLYFYNARWYDPALGRFVQADSIVPQPGNPQALNRYSYVLNNPLRYVDPTGLFTEDEIKKYLGVATWKEVGAFFREGGLLAGRWGWLAVLRQAHLGDEVQFLEGYAGFWPAPGPGATVALRGTFWAAGNSLYIQDSPNSVIAANAAAKVGNAYLLNRPSEQGLPTPFGPYYAEQIYRDHVECDPRGIDWVEAGIDVFGLVGEAVKGTQPYGPAIYAASEYAEYLGWGRNAWQASQGDFEPLVTQVIAIAIGRQVDKAKLLPGVGGAANWISLATNLSHALYWAP